MLLLFFRIEALFYYTPMHDYINHVITYILIVDDDRDDQFFLRRAIKEIIPYAIIESLYDGAEAMEFLDDCISLPNMIFLDLNMAKLSGMETIRRIRKNQYLDKIPVIILTTSRNEDEKIQVLNSGADGFYSKPDHPDDLKSMVREIVDKWIVSRAH
jgi:DNA-binding response OmpR family regulator